MRRALELARHGLGHVSPNPMVGCVLVVDNCIIGEGWHRRYGEGHAEVNAVASVADPALLRRSTMYVTLEPCSHYGKTPPCAKMILARGIPRVVIGCLDPFEKVSGRGVAMLRAGGVEVVAGLLEEECRDLNKRFIYAHTHRMPWVSLKWAQSADRYLYNPLTHKPVAFSTAITSQLVHTMRSRYDAILVGAGTVLVDNPRLDVRKVDGRSPIRVVLDEEGVISADAAVLRPEGRVIYVSENLRADVPDYVEQLVGKYDVEQLLRTLYSRGITSLMVEGGVAVLKEFLASDFWCDARVEVSPIRLAVPGSEPHMSMPHGVITSVEHADGNTIIHFAR